MKKITLLLTALICTCAFLTAQPVNVTIQVDMNQVTDLYTGGSVWVYMDSGWSEYYDMTDPDANGIYTYTLQKDAGSALTYSFSYQTGPDPNNDYVVETVPAECANLNGFRELTVPSSDIILPAYFYGGCYETGVTLRVDINAVSNLYPGGAVWVYMDSGWSEYYDMTDGNNDGIYAVTLQKDPDSTLTYSFSYQTGPDPNSDYITEIVPAECANGDGFRELLVPAGDTVLPAFAFGSCNDVPPSTVNITFRVDMNNETVINNDVQVVIKNPWIWTALADEGNGVWSGTANVQAGSTYPYTFVNGGQDYWDGEESVPAECNYGTETAPERHVTVADSDTTLELVAFGECGSTIVEKVMVTFRVDMKDEIVSSNGVQLVIKGPWTWVPLADVGNDIWEAAVELTANMSFPYSFVNGAQDYWAGEEIIVGECKDGDNNQRIAGISSSDTALPAFIFGTCAPRTQSVFDNELAHAFKVYPNPADNRIVVESEAYEMNSVSIISLDGSLVALPKIINNNYLTVDLSEITNGVYILMIRGENVLVHKRLVICH